MSVRPPDTSLAWCLERLATEKLTRGIMTALIEDLCSNRDLSIPDHLKLRILLQDLELQREIADDTLEVLQNIQDTLLNTDDGSLISSEYMYPPPELLLQVKVQIVASTWQGSDAPPKSADIIEKIIKAFGQPAHHEEKTYDELIKAAGDATHRPEIDAKVAKFGTLAGIHRYAAWAKQHLGPVVLQIICKDINDGVYFPGYRPPITRQTEPLRATGLKEARAALRSAGGEDPLQQAYAKAALATQGQQQGHPDNQNHRDVTPAAAIIAGAGTDTVDAVIRREVATSPPPRIRTSDSPVIPSNGEEVLGYRVHEMGRKSLPSGLGGHRMKIWWSPEEEAALIEACRECQPGHWAEIKARYGKEGQPLQHRDPMDLKDKWRNLLRGGNAMALQITEEHALRYKNPETKVQKGYGPVDNTVMLENLLKSTEELQRRIQIIESGNKKAKSNEGDVEDDGLRMRTRAVARKNPTPREEEEEEEEVEDDGLRIRTRAAARKNPTPRDEEEEEEEVEDDGLRVRTRAAARKNPTPREEEEEEEEVEDDGLRVRTRAVARKNPTPREEEEEEEEVEDDGLRIRTRAAARKNPTPRDEEEEEEEGDIGNIQAARKSPPRVSTRRTTARILRGLVSIAIGKFGNGLSSSGGDGGPATSASLINPQGVAVDSDGNIYISESNVIRKMDTSGVICTIAGGSSSGYSVDVFGGAATDTGLPPRGTAVDSPGNLFIAMQGKNFVAKVNASGIITAYAGNGAFAVSGDGGPATSASLFSSVDVALDTQGELYIADKG